MTRLGQCSGMSPEEAATQLNARRLPLRSGPVSESGFSRASGIAWEDYYKAIEGRPVRALFLEARPFLPNPRPGERARVAIDLGCGDGSETLALLARGWVVVAVDGAPESIVRLRASVQPEDAKRLTTVVGAFHEVELPDADFVYAGLSLPFCAPGEFTDVWRAVEHALSGGGLFAGHFFGPHDSWASTPDMSFQTREQLDVLFTGFDVHVLREQDEDGPAVSGPKHWHVFHVIATMRRPG
jgi:SAM-dependent methyltransferase